MVLLFYTTYISVDLAHHELFCAKLGKGGINKYIDLKMDQFDLPQKMIYRQLCILGLNLHFRDTISCVFCCCCFLFFFAFHLVSFRLTLFRYLPGFISYYLFFFRLA